MKILKKQTPPDTGEEPERELAYAVAEAVYQLRTEQGMSQVRLAELAATKQPRISNLESANGIPSLRLLLRIASALGVRVTIQFEKPPGEKR